MRPGGLVCRRPGRRPWPSHRRRRGGRRTVVVFAVRGAGDKGQQAADDTEVRIIRTAEEAYCAQKDVYAPMDKLVAERFLSEEPKRHQVDFRPAPNGGPCGGTGYSISPVTTPPQAGPDPCPTSGAWCVIAPPTGHSPQSSTIKGNQAGDAMALLPNGKILAMKGDRFDGEGTFAQPMSPATARAPARSSAKCSTPEAAGPRPKHHWTPAVPVPATSTASSSRRPRPDPAHSRATRSSPGVPAPPISTLPSPSLVLRLGAAATCLLGACRRPGHRPGSAPTMGRLADVSLATAERGPIVSAASGTTVTTTLMLPPPSPWMLR